MAGNKKNVLNRWGGRKDRKARTPRKPFKGKPQYMLDDLYISPFTHELSTDEVGRRGYLPMEKNMTPTGIKVMDEYLLSLHKGMTDITTFCDRYGAKTADLDGMVFLLTGMGNLQFRACWMVRCADDLLRYTDMEVAEVARRCGAGSRGNLYFIYERDLNCSPTDRREALRRDGDLGRYKIIE